MTTDARRRPTVRKQMTIEQPDTTARLQAMRMLGYPYTGLDFLWLLDQLTRATATIQQLEEQRDAALAFLRTVGWLDRTSETNAANLIALLGVGVERAEAPSKNGLASASASEERE